jgi:hypothetical protein
MTTKENLIHEIIDMEWGLFQKTRNIGGPADCQKDRKAFELHRISQALAWTEAPLKSYLTDLKEAVTQGRNLVSEKYARMMESTDPEEYARIEHLLPPLSHEVSSLVNKIIEIVIQWQEDLTERFPYILERGRTLYNSDDTPHSTSFETYLKGELETYSFKTLELYYECLLEQKRNNVNASEIDLEHKINHYGYDSMEDANTTLMKKIGGGFHVGH